VEGESFNDNIFASDLLKDVILYSKQTELFLPRMKERILADLKKKPTQKEMYQVLTNNSTNSHYKRIMKVLASKNIDLELDRKRLATVLHIIEDLQKSIRLAAQESLLKESILNSLRKKMDSLDN
jgi:hypothetical protein